MRNKTIERYGILFVLIGLIITGYLIYSYIPEHKINATSTTERTTSIVIIWDDTAHSKIQARQLTTEDAMEFYANNGTVIKINGIGIQKISELKFYSFPKKTGK